MTTRATRSPRRRTVVALAVVLAVLGAFFVRLVDIQVVNADEHVADSLDKALAGSQTLYGARGAIVDDTGQTLAGSILLYDCQLSPLLITQIDADIANGKSTAKPWSEVSTQIATITGSTPEAVQAIVSTALAQDASSQYAELGRGLSTEQYRALADLGAPYLACLSHPARTYPDGAVAGNLIGFVGSDGEPLEGLEAMEDSCLASTNGSLSYQKGKDGVIIPGTEREVPAVDGGTLQLTIDRDLNWYMQQLIAEQTQDMGAQSGSILVVETKTGKIRAAAEYPTVDPNNIDGSGPDDRSSRIFRGTFEPGSTFKALTASTVMDAGGQTPLSTVLASGYEKFPNGAVVRDAFAHPAYNYTLAGVLMDSSNAGISKFSEKVDTQTRYDYLKKFGIGEGSAVGFPGEASGVLRSPDQWDNQTVYNTSYGQGLTTTMPELAGAYAALGNDGVRMPLSLVESCTKADGTVVTPKLPAPVRVVSAQTATYAREMLENVFFQSGVSDRLVAAGYRVGGKTGTGEKADLVNGGYKNGVYYTTMIGLAPIEDPQFVVVVTLDEPTKVKSSAANGTAFQKAVTQVLKAYRVLPSTTSPTLLPKLG
ncbi:peptidoglycan D,D-transpeptidase FtsI family protein [Microbacterium sp.]|uniref:peptidoglycan D,D-transpeptidase FtsI family protein n=1 Tax=Microbacterium sp. TaxID=51671 RepID=UPI003F71163F